jgi:hypothetical protein
MWIVYWKFADEWDNPVEIPCIYNVEGDNRLSLGRQPLTTGSVLKFRSKQSRFVMFFFIIPEIIFLSSTKQTFHKYQ